MQCGFKGITKKSKILLKETKENSWFFDTELVLLAKERGLSVEEIPVRWIENRHGTKIRVFNDLFELVLFIFSFKKRLKKQCIEKKQKAF